MLHCKRWWEFLLKVVPALLSGCITNHVKYIFEQKWISSLIKYCLLRTCVEYLPEFYFPYACLSLKKVIKNETTNPKQSLMFFFLLSFVIVGYNWITVSAKSFEMCLSCHTMQMDHESKLECLSKETCLTLINMSLNKKKVKAEIRRAVLLIFFMYWETTCFTRFKGKKKRENTSFCWTSASVLPVWPPTSGKGHPLVVTAKLDAIKGLRAKKKIAFHPLPAQTNTVIKSALAQTSRGL